MNTATLRCCPNCWAPLEDIKTEDLSVAHRKCPRCGYAETLSAVVVTAPRHCSTCTCETAARVQTRTA